MNQGLKGYTKQLVHDIDNVGSLCMNMNKENANTHLVIPIVRTTGHSPIQLDLVYSYLERNEESLFGKGFKLSSYKELTEISGGYRIYNGDGSYDDYLSSNGYFNKETLYTLESFVSEDEDDDTTYYRLKDMQGNNIKYAVFNNGYNYETNKVNEDFIVSIPQGSSGLKFYNRYSDVVYIDKDGDIVTIIYKYGSKVMSTVKLTLSSFKLSKIQYYEGESTLYKEVLLTYSDTELLVKDNTHKNICKIEFLNSLPHKVFNGFETIPEDETEEAEDEYESTPTYSITYENYKTIVVNKQNKQCTYYFNKQNLPIFEKDNTGKIRKYMYDDESKRLVFEEPFATDSTNNLMHEVKFTDFYGISHLTVTDKDSSLIDEAVYELFGNELKQISGSGATSYTIDKEGQAGEVYSLSFFAEGNSTENEVKYLRVAIIYDLNGTEKIIALPVGKMQAFTIYETASTNFETIKILISLENTQTVSIGGFTLLKNVGPTECVYTNNNLTKIKNTSSVETSYDTDNFPEEITTSEGEQTNITYTSNKNIASQENEVGTKTTKTFDDTYKNKETSSGLVSSDGLMSICQEKEYSTDGRLVIKETNFIGKSTSFEYDSLERLYKVTDALNKATTMSYYKGNLSTITLNGENNISQTLGYDDRDRLSQIVTNGESIYKFEYNYKNQLTKVKVDNQVITEYDYDDFGNVKWLKHSSGDYFDFFYDSNNNLRYIYCNDENIFDIECDANGKVLSVFDVETEDQATYEYDEYDQIKTIVGRTAGKNYAIEVKRNNKEKANFVIREVEGNKVTCSINDFLSKKEDLENGDNVKIVNFTQGNIDTYGSVTQNKFEIIPLHTTLDSINGNKPYATMINDEEDESVFTYNIVNKRYCFDGTKGFLEYDTNFADTGVIFARVFIPTLSTTQNIFTLSNGIKLNVNTLGKLVLNIDESNYTTNLTMTPQTWHAVALSIGEFGQGSNSITSIDRDYRVYLDGNTYSFTDSVSTEFTSIRVKVGTSLWDSDIKFDGQMEMLCFRNAYSEVSTLNKLKEELDNISFKLTIDEFNRPGSKEIYLGSKSLVKNSYLFKSKENNAYQTSPLISSEWIYLTGETTTRHYNYDLLNRVSSIQDEVFGNKEYTYNERGFLENDNGKVITYDNNGNIDSITEGGLTRQFTYHSTIKDKLLSAGDVTLTYSSTNPLYPSKIGNKDLTWLGKRLVSISLDGVTYSYTCNEKGQRVKKSSPSEDKVFFYEGDRLVTEIGTNNRLDFLYDSQGLLFGFILNNTSKYFYVRDILQNILGIVDENGILVVKYEYEAFGKILSIEDFSSNSIGNLNPFRYKGYYYDEETQLFYCNSRYYSPELCRFISPDSIEYLDPQSINGLNLYCYCMNNPIMYADPSGHFVITLSAVLWAAAIGAAIGAVSGAVYGGTTAAANDQNVWAGIGIGALTGGFMGAGAGIASLFIAPVLVGEGVMVATATGAGFVIGNALSAGAALAIGAGIAFGSGAIGGAASDMLTQVANTGKVSDWNSVGVSAFQWGLINTAGAFLGSVGGPLSNLETALVSGMLGNVTGLIGLTADVIRDRNNKRKQMNNLSYMYSYGF